MRLRNILQPQNWTEFKKKSQALDDIRLKQFVVILYKFTPALLRCLIVNSTSQTLQLLTQLIILNIVNV